MGSDGTGPVVNQRFRRWAGLWLFFYREPLMISFQLPTRLDRPRSVTVAGASALQPKGHRFNSTNTLNIP